ncbi:MAG: hypothetical protein A4S17_13905 [Proteobacteria bacterium HN_bin10]|nr:MAG: hypothetical protein A4S17_13905 [Proteobacteria bacterium HN_bin10]
MTRWVGLARKRRTAPFCGHRFAREGVRALGAAGMLFMAAAMNFALYPDALAAVVSGERSIVGFVPDEPSSPSISEQTIALDETEVRLLAATAWGEARGEGEIGMRAVAHVMVNRIGDRFGEDLAAVILAPKQFSVWNGNDPNRRMVESLARDPSSIVTDDEWAAAERIAREVLSGQSVDPTDGALFYHARSVRPRWARAARGRQVIGQHIFYADVPGGRARWTPVDMAAFFGQVFTGGDAELAPLPEATLAADNTLTTTQPTAAIATVSTATSTE